MNQALPPATTAFSEYSLENDMEVAERRYWPGEPRDRTAKSVSSPSRMRGGSARLDTKAGGEKLADRVQDTEKHAIEQIQRWEEHKAQMALTSKPKPNARPAPALEDLPMISNSIKEAAVFAGIDYHKKTIAVTLGDAKGAVLGQYNLQNHSVITQEFFGQFGHLECAVESCRGYEWFVDQMRAMGHNIDVGDSRSIKLIAQSRCKTDKIDSRILMELRAIGFLPTTYIPTALEREYRELLRHRATMVRTTTRSKLRVHALLDKENKGIRYPFTISGRKYLREVDLAESRKQIVERELEIIDFFDEQVHTQEQRIIRFARNQPDIERLRTIPGFSILMATAFYAEIGDPTRFRTSDQVAAYIGLVPRVYSSGNTTRCGRITKTGSKFMRWMLVQAAWVAVKHSPNLRAKFTGISRRRGSKVAIISIARTLATIAFRILKDKSNYKEEKLDAGLARATF
ncbi:MAG: IS110 family transposase [Candidatus Obscuribacterales bacterium]